ncbi:hypothetical protein [Wolbachia endosymbiont of Mansonella perstans]|uniref:hypothetical protein n=1 Tax=Wolbachia endosymbiont of Mansonella perstans TaxID=229526 RepID=UPI001CE0B311|nr:hypothetical protein [Wolbachia endosymbiont of Mansonella perstans]MCA4774211.1 hypothetical protein [Wolbachia endosymbiont of Mansonella perstans]
MTEERSAGMTSPRILGQHPHDGLKFDIRTVIRVTLRSRGFYNINLIVKQQTDLAKQTKHKV